MVLITLLIILYIISILNIKEWKDKHVCSLIQLTKLTLPFKLHFWYFLKFDLKMAKVCTGFHLYLDLQEYDKHFKLQKWLLFIVYPKVRIWFTNFYLIFLKYHFFSTNTFNDLHITCKKHMFLIFYNITSKAVWICSNFIFASMKL